MAGKRALEKLVEGLAALELGAALLANAGNAGGIDVTADRALYLRRLLVTTTLPSLETVIAGLEWAIGRDRFGVKEAKHGG